MMSSLPRRERERRSQAGDFAECVLSSHRRREDAAQRPRPPNRKSSHWYLPLWEERILVRTESFLFVVHEESPAHVLLARWHSRPDTAKARASNADARRGSMKFRPLQDRVLIRRIEQDEKTAGGIIIPDTAKEKPMEGEVVAVGPGARGEAGTHHPLDGQAGDRVLS